MTQIDLSKFRNKNIHIVGITGAEGSAILSFFLKHGIKSITGHDFVRESEIEKSFKIWHKGLNKFQRDAQFQSFKESLVRVKTHFHDKYLSGISEAEVIFVSQNWYSYPQNKILHDLQKTKSFYSMTRLYLELSPAVTVGITGTVGKGSVSRMLVHILKESGRRVYFGGNDSWSEQVLDRLDVMTKKDILVLEISHRQLLEDFDKSPHIAVITNVYPDHGDEISLSDYQKAKYKILAKQTKNDIAVLNFDDRITREFGRTCPGRVYYFSLRHPGKMHLIRPDAIIDKLKVLGAHNQENALAASLAVALLGVKLRLIQKGLSTFSGIKARLEEVMRIGGVTYYDDLKSTTPWATMAAISTFTGDIILIMGGDNKKLDYISLARLIDKQVKLLVVLKSEVGEVMQRLVKKTQIIETEDLRESLVRIQKLARTGDKVILSPGGAFFYSRFIAQKESLQKILISLLPKEPI